MDIQALLNEQIIEKKKRVRTPANLIVRYYKCTHGNCKKAYGKLGSLNKHIRIHNHGHTRRVKNFVCIVSKDSGNLEFSQNKPKYIFNSIESLLN
jgi:hypothetical protein